MIQSDFSLQNGSGGKVDTVSLFISLNGDSCSLKINRKIVQGSEDMSSMKAKSF